MWVEHIIKVPETGRWFACVRVDEEGNALTLGYLRDEDMRNLVRAADIALQEYGTDEHARSARRAAEALGLSFQHDHGLPEHSSPTGDAG